MKYLSQFQSFDSTRFFADKVLIVTGIKDWLDNDTKEALGKKVELAIIKDDTSYNQKEGEQASNLYEKVTVKVNKRDFVISVNTQVMLCDVTATVYGEYRNNLSVKGTPDSFKIGKPRTA